ncbi:IS630 transposase-related protein [Candidatus Halobeggiatoa sp. HSG11]|nr:IS630 transposase-related protein [Candidatus Halobeggiatoa sp. HSG11]
MAKTYSMDLRKKIVETYKNGEGSIRKLAKRFKVSKGFIFSLLKRQKETGTIAPKPHGKGRNPSIKIVCRCLLQTIK